MTTFLALVAGLLIAIQTLSLVSGLYVLSNGGDINSRFFFWQLAGIVSYLYLACFFAGVL